MMFTIQWRMIFVAMLAVVFSSCKKVFIDSEVTDSPNENFEYLWNDIKNRYSYLDYKGVDWDAIHVELSAQIYDGMSQEQLFAVLADMMNRLRDGHVNLTSPFNVSNYYPIFLSSPQNYDSRLVLERYLLRNPDDYYITGSLQNTIIDTLGVKVGYLRYSSFLSALQSSDIDYVINRFNEADVDGVIVDVRSNGGGSVSNVFKLTNRFADSTRLAYTSDLKIGPGPSDFGNEEQTYIGPAGAQQFTKRVAILTNRGCYSATSLFCLAMKSLPYVKMIGDSTGGGLGAPTGAELPNGWTYRFSVTRTLSPNNDNWEDGIPADIFIDLDPALAAEGYDSIIERAIEYIIKGE